MTARKRKPKRRKLNTPKHKRKVAARARQHQKSYQPGAR